MNGNTSTRVTAYDHLILNSTVHHLALERPWEINGILAALHLQV
jgi:hypothetical protein